MSRNSEQEEGYLEVQMDGKQVVIVVVGVLLLCAISYYFGLRVGRADAAGRDGNVTAGFDGSPEALQDEDAAADLTFFDHVGDRPTAVTPPGVAEGDRSQSQPQAPTAGSTPLSVARDEPRPAARTASPSPAVTPVTEPAVAAPSRGDTATASPAGNLEIQVGVYSRQSAESLAARLSAKGYHPTITPTNSQGKQVFRVRVGGYATRAAADAAATRLQTEEKLATWIPPQGG